MFEEISESEVEIDNTEEDTVEHNIAEYEQELYSIVNFSSYVEEEALDIHSDCQSFYSTTRRRKAARLLEMSKVIKQLKEPTFVDKITEFSKESVQAFIPLSASTPRKQQNSKHRKHSLNGVKNNLVKKRARPYDKQRAHVVPRDSGIGTTQITTSKVHNVEPDVVVLSDSDSSDILAVSKHGEHDVLIISGEDEILEVSHKNNQQQKVRTVIQEHSVAPETSDTNTACNEMSVADVLTVLRSDINRSEVLNVSDDHDLDIQVLPTPTKPCPPLVTLDSGDEISPENSSKIQLVNTDTDNCIMIDEGQVASSSVKPSSCGINSAFGPCWTPAMIKFYNESWGGEDFDHRIIQKTTSKSPEKWQVVPTDITQPVMSRRKKRLLCKNCNQRGHMIVKCPDPLRIKVCSLCGQRNHKDTRCPNRKCSRCGAFCFDYGKFGCSFCVNRHIQCNHCDSVQHIDELCPEVWRCYHHTTHAALDKLRDHPAENLKPGPQQCCPNCGKRGHMYEDCGQMNWSGDPSGFSFVQRNSNGWSKFKSPRWLRAQHNRDFSQNPHPVMQNATAVAKQLRKMNFAAEAKFVNALRMKKLMKKRKKKEKQAARQAAGKNDLVIVS